MKGNMGGFLLLARVSLSFPSFNNKRKTRRILLVRTRLSSPSISCTSIKLVHLKLRKLSLALVRRRNPPDFPFIINAGIAKASLQ